MIKILNFKPKESGALRGFADVLIEPWGFEIREISVFESNGKKWVSMPSRSYEKDGKKQYWPYNRFIDREKEVRFQQAFFTSLEAWKRQNPQPVQQTQPLQQKYQQQEIDLGECPF